MNSHWIMNHAGDVSFSVIGSQARKSRHINVIKKEISLIMSHYHAADTLLLRKRKDTKFPTDHSYQGEKEKLVTAAAAG